MLPSPVLPPPPDDPIKELGAAVNPLPGGEIVPALDRGLLDAAEFNNATSDRILGFPDVSKVCMLQSYHQNAEQFEIMFNKDGGHDLIAQAVQKHWTKYLGVNVVLAQKEIKVFRDDLKNARYMVTRAGWYGDYGDPTTFLDLSRSTDGNNDRKYNNPEYDALLDAAKVERDPAKRMAILHEAESMIMDRDLPMVPLFHYVSLYMFDANKVTGINPHPRATQLMHLVDILGDGEGSDKPKHMPRLPAREGGSQ